MKVRDVPHALLVTVLVVSLGGCSPSSSSSTLGEPERVDKEADQPAESLSTLESGAPEMTEGQREMERLRREYGYSQWPKEKDDRFYPCAKGFRETAGELAKAFECDVIFTESVNGVVGSARAVLGKLLCVNLKVMENQEAAKKYLILYLAGAATLPWELRHGTPPTFEVGDVMVDEGDTLSFVRYNVAIVVRMSSGNGEWPLTHEQLIDIAKRIDEMILREAEPIRKPRE